MADTDNPPAFPLLDVHAGRHKTGMSLRDWFAGQALVGMSSSLNTAPPDALVAEIAYRLADAMLARRKKEKPDAE